jgi:hypothetical protein
MANALLQKQQQQQQQPQASLSALFFDTTIKMIFDQDCILIAGSKFWVQYF